jgi:hypothetical protein
MLCFAAAALTYSEDLDDAHYVTVGGRGPVRRAERLEQLVWEPADAFSSIAAALMARKHFAPGAGHAVWQTYVLAVKPLLLEEDVLIAYEIIDCSVPRPEWFYPGVAA